MMLLPALILNTLMFVALGAVVGFICRGRTAWIVVASLLASLAFYVAEMFYTGLLSIHWSASDYLMASAYQIGPFLAFSFPPCLVSAMLVGRWRNRSRESKPNI
jgi:hypothetical protein